MLKLHPLNQYSLHFAVLALITYIHKQVTKQVYHFYKKIAIKKSNRYQLFRTCGVY